MRHRGSFNQILSQVSDENSRRVAERAALASQIAKHAANPRSRAAAYALKAATLRHGIDKFPFDYRLASMEDGGRLFGLHFRHELSLHLPASRSDEATRRWVDVQRFTVSKQWAAALAA